MKYTAKYKIILDSVYPSLFKIYTFPFIQIKFRKNGDLFWVKCEDMPIDLFAYNHLQFHYDSDVALRDLKPSVRIEKLKKIIASKYEGSMAAYIKDFICSEIREIEIVKQINKQDNETIESFVTHGWKKIEVELEE